MAKHKIRKKKQPPHALHEIISGLVVLDDELLEVLSLYHYHTIATLEIMTNGLEEDKARLLFGHSTITYWLKQKARNVLDDIVKLKERAIELEGRNKN